MSEIPGLYVQHPIIERHKNVVIYHLIIETLILALTDIPITIIIIIIGFSIVLHFMVGLQQSAVCGRKDISMCHFSDI